MIQIQEYLQLHGLDFITAVILSQDSKMFYPRLYHNKVAASGSYITGDGHKTGTFDIVLYLQKGDEVYIAGHNTHTIYSDGFAHVTFPGILLRSLKQK